ncbi:uncharacterized protein TM35_000451260 [Trypanosoma theileri]|uniref:Mucin TcMUCII n=1 Tax=Trypanosoma theileri TaxID=67003 RepID=A0A1X0NIN8_9TRYP|nr:uncharacterized protein TM35_000451260 [Trypanosoma theileri]ORC84388.1 hypothetical protein TM35_000451260 [Trypanosoma theileri]
MMMMMMRRVMCVLAVVLCCACGYTMAAAAVSDPTYDIVPNSVDNLLQGFPVITRDERERADKYLKCIQGKNDTEKEKCAQSSDPEKDQPAKTQLPQVPETRPDASGQSVGGSGHGTSSHVPAGGSHEHGAGTVQPSTDQNTNKPTTSDSAQDGAAINDCLNRENQVTEGNTSTTDNATLGVSTDSPDSTNQSQVSGTTAPNSTSGADSHEINPTTPPSPENTTTEAPTTTPSLVPKPEISNTIASAVKNNKGNVDSSLSPVWMHTAAPLLIVVVLFSATLY